MWDAAQANLLEDGKRLHLQHGPIDLVIEAFGTVEEVKKAYEQAIKGFQLLLATLVEELTALKRPLGKRSCLLQGPVACRMLQATWPHRHQFITPMAAVAGAVADEVLGYLTRGRQLERAYVNNGGDIALYVGEKASLEVGIISRVSPVTMAGSVRIESKMLSRGIATSGFGGRSQSFGIADAVTVLAKNAAVADGAATLIANQVNVEDALILRQPATEVDDNSDLGNKLVTLEVGPLSREKIQEAISLGALEAWKMLEQNLIHGAAIFLGKEKRFIGRAWQELRYQP